MKKFLAMLLSVVMVLSLVGCRGKTNTNTSTNESKGTSNSNTGTSQTRLYHRRESFNLCFCF